MNEKNEDWQVNCVSPKGAATFQAMASEYNFPHTTDLLQKLCPPSSTS